MADCSIIGHRQSSQYEIKLLRLHPIVMLSRHFFNLVKLHKIETETTGEIIDFDQ